MYYRLKNKEGNDGMEILAKRDGEYEELWVSECLAMSVDEAVKEGMNGGGVEGYKDK